MAKKDEDALEAMAQVAQAIDQLGTTNAVHHTAMEDVLEKIEGHLGTIAQRLTEIAENSDFDRVDRERAAPERPKA